MFWKGLVQEFHGAILYLMPAFLAVYGLFVFIVFRRRKNNRRRRGEKPDWAWVPLGAVTGVLLLALWWHMRQVPQGF